MVKYSCERCGKGFSQKSQYNSHNRQKTPCENNTNKTNAPVDKAVEVKLKKINNKKLIVENTINTDKKMTEHKIQKPFLKWVGGKTQIINDIISKIPEEMNNYHELFLGGGSVLLAILSLQKQNKIVIKNKIYVYDINSVLINVYKHIQTNKDELYKLINLYIKEYDSIEQFTISPEYKNLKSKKKLIRNITDIVQAKTSKESYYYWIRNKFNSMDPSTVERSASIYVP